MRCVRPTTGSTSTISGKPMTRLPPTMRAALSLAATLLALLSMATTPHAAAAEPARVDSDWILSRLVQPVPARTAFVELRGSRLLKKPLRLQGEYRRPDADTLVRQVTTPYAETTTIRAGE